MKLSVTGLNHRTSPVEVREKLSFRDSELAGALERLHRLGAQEAMLLSTCNRVEVTLITPDKVAARELALQFLAGERQVDPQLLARHLYHYEGAEAIRHLFRVAAGLDSMVVGEPQILGQMKQAFSQAKACGVLKSRLETVLNHAFRVAKRVRTETAIGRNAVSVSYVAVELARQIFGQLAGCTVLLVGAGKMAELAAVHLQNAGVSRMLVTNRTRARAEEVARRFAAEAVDFDQFYQELHRVDIVLVSTGASGYVLGPAEVRRAIEKRRNRPMFLIDISVPRNIDPATNELDNVFLYDIDDLQRVVEQNLKHRLQEAQEAEQLIEEEVNRVLARLKAEHVTPTIVSLQQLLEELRQAELQRARGKLAQLPPEYRELVESITRGLINRIAHRPLTCLRQMATEPNGEEALRIARRLFGLES